MNKEIDSNLSHWASPSNYCLSTTNLYYPIETLVEVGVIDILIITSPQHTSDFMNALGDGSKFGVRFTYSTQMTPEGAAQAFTIGEKFLQKESVCFITGDCIILGDDRAAKLRKAIRAAKNCGQELSLFAGIMILTNMAWLSLTVMASARS